MTSSLAEPAQVEKSVMVSRILTAIDENSQTGSTILAEGRRGLAQRHGGTERENRGQPAGIEGETS